MKTFHSQEMAIILMHGSLTCPPQSRKDARSRINFTEKSDFKMYMRSIEGGEGLAQQGKDN